MSSCRPSATGQAPLREDSEFLSILPLRLPSFTMSLTHLQLKSLLHQMFHLGTPVTTHDPLSSPCPSDGDVRSEVTRQTPSDVTRLLLNYLPRTKEPK